MVQDFVHQHEHSPAGLAVPKPHARRGPCAKALLLVAHRDDETLFAGRARVQGEIPSGLKV